ncbi:MAG: NAD-dependent epimerase/dehydratase family protein [Clostridia bacterium]|nr:NAD-dependent epimerase/dehydratase family protein [Clostridia bacterium]
MKKILVLGATGAMGRYLVPELAAMGYQVTGVSLDDALCRHENVNHIKGDAFNRPFVETLLAEKYDGIVNFMSYGSRPFADWYELFLKNTDHYIFLSSCRVYDDKEVPVRETSPRLWDSSEDEVLKASNDYCIHKAKAEDLLVASPYGNWTVVRPATTFSTMRLQLVTLEFSNSVARALQGKKVVLPIQAKDKPATLSWGGDVARMIARILFREEAKREFYNVCSAEHRTWGEIADYYKDLVGLEAVWVDKEDYLAILDPEKKNNVRWQLEYARLFHRITDNSKVLALTGLKQEDLMPMYDGLRLEIGNIPAGFVPAEKEVGRRMDAYLEKRCLP